MWLHPGKPRTADIDIIVSCVVCVVCFSGGDCIWGLGFAKCFVSRRPSRVLWEVGHYYGAVDV